MIKIDIERKECIVEIIVMMIGGLLGAFVFVGTSKLSIFIAIPLALLIFIGGCAPASISYRQNRLSHIVHFESVFTVHYRNGKKRSIKLTDKVQPEIWFGDYKQRRYGYLKIRSDNQRILLRRDYFKEDDWQKLVDEFCEDRDSLTPFKGGVMMTRSE